MGRAGSVAATRSQVLQRFPQLRHAAPAHFQRMLTVSQHRLGVAVGAAPQYNNADEGWGIPTLPPFPGEVDLSWHLINTLGQNFF